jgi:hypothetical protein
MAHLKHLHWLLLLTCGVAWATPETYSTNIFKCKGKDGVIIVSNTPCAKGAAPDAKLSGRSDAAAPAAYTTPCERVAEQGFSLVEIRTKLTPAQQRSLDAEAFGRMNSAGASRILAERRDNGMLRVCGFFNGGETIETVIETDGLVRRDGVVDSDDQTVRSGFKPRDGLGMCSERIGACQSGQSSIGVGFEQCVREIPVCSTEVTDDCCPQACISAYWKPPYEHQAGLASMKATAACRDARGLRH